MQTKKNFDKVDIRSKRLMVKPVKTLINVADLQMIGFKGPVMILRLWTSPKDVYLRMNCN